jgi:hypothetical protein
MKHPSFSRALALVLGTLMLSGCMATSKPLYEWDSYPAQVYGHFKGESPEAQIAALEQQLQKTQANGASTPPGLHAHLGMLYSKVGRDDQMVQQLELEKIKFPESTPFMNRLLAQLRK